MQKISQLAATGQILLLLGTHLYFTFRLRFIQRKIPCGIRLSFSGKNNTSYSALATALAATIGTGQEHLRLTSFCYGLLRPLDVIRSYRLEGDVVLPEPGNQTMFSYWKSRLTDVFIEDIKKAGGILCNLASDEMKSLFDWKRVEREVRVVTPEFQVWKNGKLASIVIYIKMSRGEMTRFILKNRIENPEDLKSFSWEGFEFNESLSDEKKFVFTNGKEI